MEFENHGTGMLKQGDAGRYFAVSEVPADQPTAVQVVLHAADAETFRLDPSVEVVSQFDEQRYPAQRMTVRDPGGRDGAIEAPVKK